MSRKKTPRINREQRRAQIKKAGIRLFAENKFQGTTMASIAKEIGVSEPLIYQHFKNKKELFLSILSGFHDEVLLESKQIIQEGGDVPEVFSRLFRSYQYNATRKYPERGKTFILAASVGDEDILAEVRRFVENINRLFAQSLEKIARDTDKGLRCDPKIAARIFFSMITDRMLMAMIEMEEDVDKVFSEAVDFFFFQVVEDQ